MLLLIHNQGNRNPQPSVVPPPTIQQPESRSRTIPSAAAAEPSIPVPTSNAIQPVVTRHGIVEYLLPVSLSQSTIDGRTGSNACVFIALYFGSLTIKYGLNCPPNVSLPVSWKHALEEAMRKGNEIHDELFDNAAVNVSVEEAVELVAEDCNVLAVVQEYNA